MQATIIPTRFLGPILVSWLAIVQYTYIEYAFFGLASFSLLVVLIIHTTHTSFVIWDFRNHRSSNLCTREREALSSTLVLHPLSTVASFSTYANDFSRVYRFDALLPCHLLVDISFVFIFISIADLSNFHKKFSKFSGKR